ncbi:MAG: beta-lactamase family protein [Acidimicrobiia bacterium]|nr:beta-lactamase family protein [Acidimicrobiia bacterium]
MTDGGSSGFCAPGWEGVRDAFEANFTEHGDLGAGTAIHHDGRLVVDLWGGTYETDSLQSVFSTTKGWTAALASLLVERGELDLDAPVASYWAEFAAAGKDKIPVRWLLTHQAGLPFPEEPATLEDVLSWDGIVDKLARSAPVWEPGSAHGYHAVTYGFLVGEVLRRVSGRTVGTLLADEIAGPLGLDMWIGLPAEHHHRVVDLVGGLSPDPSDIDPAMREMLELFMGPDTTLGKALSCHGAFGATNVWNSAEVRSAEIPAANGVTDARSLSRFYAALVGDVDADERFPAGKQVLTDETVAAASTRHTSGNDQVIMFETTIGLGFWTCSPFAPYGGIKAFGHGGAGGSLGFADPENGLGFGYVMSKMQQNLTGDPRTRTLVRAAYEAIGVEPAHV